MTATISCGPRVDGTARLPESAARARSTTSVGHNQGLDRGAGRPSLTRQHRDPGALPLNQKILYDDGKIACHDTGLLIRRYYPWGAKRIRYSSVRSVKRLPIAVRRWRLWGSGDFRHWWNLDLNRPKHTVALDIDIGRWIHPTITPDDPDTVEQILNDRLAPQSPER